MVPFGSKNGFTFGKILLYYKGCLVTFTVARNCKPKYANSNCCQYSSPFLFSFILYFFIYLFLVSLELLLYTHHQSAGLILDTLVTNLEWLAIMVFVDTVPIPRRPNQTNRDVYDAVIIPDLIILTFCPALLLSSMIRFSRYVRHWAHWNPCT